MESIAMGDLVTVATAGPQIDGIVFDASGDAKVVVAVIDRTRGPVLRPFDRDALSERADAGDDDRALELLIRRTHASAGPDGARGGTGGGVRRAAHTRGPSHRPTGR